jgi:hypothetical protein
MRSIEFSGDEGNVGFDPVDMDGVAAKSDRP